MTQVNQQPPQGGQMAQVPQQGMQNQQPPEWQSLSMSVLGNPNGEVSYNVAGAEVKLSYYIVQKFLTRGGAQPSFQDIIQFILICKLNQLNPFLNEAYFIKFANDVQMIVSKEALLKRAEAHQEYNGYEAGIIVMREGEVKEIEGSFALEKDVLLGGWAKVYRKDRAVPIKSTVDLKEYDKNTATWKGIKKTMIRKVALCQALREAFPSQLGAIYTEDEARAVRDIPYEDVTDKVNADVHKPQAEAPTFVQADPIPAQQPMAGKGDPIPASAPTPTPTATQKRMPNFMR